MQQSLMIISSLTSRCPSSTDQPPGLNNYFAPARAAELAAIGTLGFVSRVERQGADAQHASGREFSIVGVRAESS